MYRRQGGTNTDTIRIDPTSSEAFTIYGLAGDDVFTTSTDTDTLIGGSGDDTIFGGEGADVSLFNGPTAASQFIVSSYARLILSATDGTDTLDGVEMLSFTYVYI